MKAFSLDLSVLEHSATDSGGDGVNAPTVSELASVIIWLDGFHQDAEHFVALDNGFKLWQEYHAFGENNYALRVLMDKIDRNQVHSCEVRYHDRQVVVVPTAFAAQGAAWKLALAVAITDRGVVSVVNATDTNWVRHEAELTREGVRVEQLLQEWLQAHVQLMDAPPPQPGDHRYHIPPDRLNGVLESASCVGVGSNGRKAWEMGGRRYEFDRQHNTLEVYEIASARWIHECSLDGTVTKESGGEGRRWGRR